MLSIAEVIEIDLRLKALYEETSSIFNSSEILPQSQLDLANSNIDEFLLLGAKVFESGGESLTKVMQKSESMTHFNHNIAQMNYVMKKEKINFKIKEINGESTISIKDMHGNILIRERCLDTEDILKLEGLSERDQGYFIILSFSMSNPEAIQFMHSFKKFIDFQNAAEREFFNSGGVEQ